VAHIIEVLSLVHRERLPCSRRSAQPAARERVLQGRGGALGVGLWRESTIARESERARERERERERGWGGECGGGRRGGAEREAQSADVSVALQKLNRSEGMVRGIMDKNLFTVYIFKVSIF
jgi:hypothetical protein